MGNGKTDTQKVDGLTGEVVRGPFGAGSKSERQAIWLETARGRFVLRRKDGPTFGDKMLDKYIGKRVACDGFIVEYMLLVEHIEIVP